MSATKRRKDQLNDENVLKCLECIDNDDAKGLYKLLTPEILTKAVYPDGTESSKTRLIFHAIKTNKIKCVSPFLKFGLDVDMEYTDHELDQEDFASLSPIHYCIEGKYSLNILQKFLAWKKRRATQSQIISALLANNAPALRLLFLTVPKSVLFHQAKPIHVSDILNCYAEHPEIEIIDTLDVVSKFLCTVDNFRTLNFHSVPLRYLASKRTNCSFKEAMEVIKLCRFFHCSLESLSDIESPIHVAMDHNNRNFVKALVEHGANVSRISRCGKTVLYEAFLKKDEDLGEFLLRKGADSQQKNINYSYDEFRCLNTFSLHGTLFRNDSCVFYSALKCLDVKLVFKIMQLDKNLNVEGDICKPTYPTLFIIFGYFICQRMDNVPYKFLLDITKACISLGFDVNTKCLRRQLVNDVNFKGHTILHLAIRFFNGDFCRALVEIGADPNLITSYNQDVNFLTLDYLLGVGCEETYQNEYIIFPDKLAFVKECKNDLKSTVLPIPDSENPKIRRFKYFSGHNSESPVQIILKSETNFVFMSCYTSLVTPGTLGVKDLELALKTSRFIIAYLVLNDMDKKLRLECLNISVVGFLFKEDQTLKMVFTKDCFARKVFQTLTRRGFDINSVDDDGNSVFHYAAGYLQWTEKSIKNFFRLMIKLGGYQSIDCVNKRLQSPLHWALSVRRKSVHNEYFCQIDCKVKNSLPSLNPMTALVKSALVKAFLCQGADIHRKTCDGYSAIHIAINSGIMQNVQQLIDKSGDIVNSWRKLPSKKIEPHEDEEDGNIEQVTWPYSAVDMYYIVTPLSVAIINGDREIVKCLLNNGAVVCKHDIHNSLYTTGFKDFSLTNFLFEYFPEDYSLESDCIFDGKVPTLEYIFDELVQDATSNTNNKTPFDTNALMTFASNYISRKYDINVRGCLKYPPVIFSFVKLALQGVAVPSANTKLFTYLLDHSDYKFVTFNDREGTEESILTFLLSVFCSHCSSLRKCAFDFVSKKIFHPLYRRKVLCQREYFIRMLLQRCPSSKWDACHFSKYIYHKEDDEILSHILLTGARNNLIREWPLIEACQMGSNVNTNKHFIGIENFQNKLHSKHPISLAESCIMNINEFSSDVKSALASVELPDNIKKVITFLGAEEDEDLSLEIFSQDYKLDI